MSTAMTTLVIALVTLGVLGLGAIELWLFWKLGEYDDRRRPGRAGTTQPAVRPSERRRDGHDRHVIAGDSTRVTRATASSASSAPRRGGDAPGIQPARGQVRP